MPHLSSAFLVFTLKYVSLPGTSSCVGEFLVVTGGVPLAHVYDMGSTCMQVGGLHMPAKQRAALDAVVAHAASTSAAAQCKLEEGSTPVGKASDVRRLSLAAVRALTSSVLAPARHRPPFLPLALRLLRGVSLPPPLEFSLIANEFLLPRPTCPF